MRIGVFSDTHFGYGTADGGLDPRDDFGGDDRDGVFYCKLAWASRQCDRIICAGDLVEGWECDDLDKIVAGHSMAMKAIKRFVTAIVPGNHDVLIEGLDSFQGVPIYPMGYERDGLCVKHGHQADPVNSGGFWTFVGRTVAFLGGVAERVIHRDVDVWAERLLQRITRSGRHGDEERYVKYASEMFEGDWRRRCVVLGHTHRRHVEGIPIIERAWYANSGCWVGGREDFLVVDTSDWSARWLATPVGLRGAMS